MFKYVRYTNFSKMCFFPEKNSQFPEDMEKSSELSAFLGAVPVPLGPLGYNISP